MVFVIILGLEVVELVLGVILTVGFMAMDEMHLVKAA